MAVTINASTTTGLVQSADTSGTIELQNNGTTRLTVNSSGATIPTATITTGTITTLNAPSGVLATQNGMTGIAKAWVNFNGTGTVAIRASMNVSSITDEGTGQYTINMTTSMPNTNYAIVASCGAPGNAKMSAEINVVGDAPVTDSPPTVSSFRILTTRYDSANTDSKYVSVAVFSS
jgi:hypothetical protein